MRYSVVMWMWRNQYCLSCGDRLPDGQQHGLFCSPCWYIRRIPQNRAHAAVAAAIKKGRLPKPETQRCVDCGRLAQQYDHKDYANPLHVSPVCRKCNIRRGPVEAAGGPSAVARALGITKAAVGQWRRVPDDRVAQFARLSGFPARTLRPDLYDKRGRHRRHVDGAARLRDIKE